MNERLAPLFSAARVLIVAGKGGVGKTTVTALLARAAARAGLRVLAVELDGKPVLGQLVAGVDDGADDDDGDGARFLAVSAPTALEEYLRDHGFGKVARRLAATGVIDVVSTAAPGIDDIVVLGRIKQLERSGDWDLVVVDGPAAGHAVTMLTSAAGLRDAIRSGPVRAQADEVFELLHDAARCQVILVTLAETTPVNETIETAFALEDRVGVVLGPIVVNAVDTGVPLDAAAAEKASAKADADVLVAAAEFRRARRQMQDEAIAHLSDGLSLPQFHVPLLPVVDMTGADVDRLAGELGDASAGEAER